MSRKRDAKVCRRGAQAHRGRSIRQSEGLAAKQCTVLPMATGRIVIKRERGERIMQYMITWNERHQGSPIEYENAQKRILEVFSPWKPPANFKIQSFVIRVGDWGGYMLMECDDPLEVHKFCSMLPAFTLEARPVVPVADAIRAELEAMAYRDGLKNKRSQLGR